MSSDSRSTTATKPRPKWRDKHLSQLNSEQLEEVQAHRGSDIAAMVNIDSNTDSTSETDIDATQKLPKRQAGPDRVKRSKSVDRRVDDHNRQQRQTDNSNRNRQVARHDGRQDDRGYSRRRENEYRAAEQRDSRTARDNTRSEQRRSSQHETRRSPRNETARRDEVARQETYRADQVESRGYRDNRRDSADSRHASARHAEMSPPQNKPAQQDTATAEKKGVFAKLKAFKLEGPVKWGLLALAMVAMVTVSILKPIDHSSQSQLDSALTRAMIGFGLARTLNGVISVAQGTEFAVQPAGVGVNFSPGEILDPINDLVERFSFVMLLATSSLGVQKILLEVSSWAGISMLLAGAALFFLLTRIRNSAVSSMADVAGKILLLMLLVRFLIPLGSLANDWVYKQFLEPRFEESSQQLEIASERIREISTRQSEPVPSDSFADRAKNLYNSMTSKFDFDGMLDDYKNSAENVSEHAVNLIVVFILQTVVFPLLFLYLIYRLFRSVLMPSRQRA